jgi:adenylate cyclase
MRMSAGRVLIGALLALGSALGACALGGTRLARLVDLKLYDFALAHRSGTATPPVVLVLIDDRTREQFREPLIFWHKHYADLIGAVASYAPRAVGLDVVFGMPVNEWTPGADELLAQAYLAAIQKRIPVILGNDYTTETLPLPIYLVANTTQSMGFLNLTPDEDDFIRRARLYTSGRAEASFALRLARAYRGAEAEAGQPARGSANEVWIDYRKPGLIPSISMADVVRLHRAGRRAFLQNLFAGHVVIVGTDDWQDRHSTPYYHFTGGERTRGCEIHAWAVSTLLGGRRIEDASGLARIASALALALLGAALALLLRGWVAGIATAGVACAAAFASFLLLAHWTWLPPLRGMLAAGMSFTSVLIYRERAEFRIQRQLRRLFGRYVSAEVLEETLRLGRVALGGKRQRITVVVSDVRNYTSWSERCAPEQVVQQLNEYFEGMCQAIVEHGGFVNKFMGDGMLAFFGAPVPHPDHAWRALQSAHSMLSALEKMNAAWARQGRPTLEIGIGIHSGEAVVGTVGSTGKVEYTATGDTVNVASRIEGKTKELGTILISASTLNEVQGRKLEVRSKGFHELKGKSEWMELFEVLRPALDLLSVGT